MRVGGRGKKATQASSCRRSSCSSCCRSSSGGSSSRATHKVPVGEQTLYSADALIRLHGHRDNALRAATHTGEWGATGIPREGSHRRAGGSSSSSEGRTELRTFTSRTQPPPPPPSTPSPMSGPPGRGDVASRVGSSTSAARPLMAAAPQPPTTEFSCDNYTIKSTFLNPFPHPAKRSAQPTEWALKWGSKPSAPLLALRHGSSTR